LLEAYRGRDYTNALALPTYFSCNYELLDVATMTFELARWQQVKPIIYLGGITCSDGLKLENAVGSFDICNIDLNYAEKKNNECVLYELTGGVLKMVCNGDYCQYNSQVINVEYEYNFGNPTCEADNDFVVDNGLCSFSPNNNQFISWCTETTGNCEIDLCETQLGSKCSKGTWVYGGGDLPCLDIACTVDNDGDITCDGGECQSLVDSGDVSCDIPGMTFKSCIVNYDEDLCEIEEGPLLKCRASEDSPLLPCSVIYNNEQCDVLCGQDVGETELWSYDLGDYNISSTSSNTFRSIHGFDLLRFYFPVPITQGVIQFISSIITTIFSFVPEYEPRFGVLVQSNDYVLLPDGPINIPQEGLRSHYLSFNPINMITNPITDIAASFPGAYTNPRFFENATQVLYDCLSGLECDDGELHTFKNFCIKDSYLSDYGYLNCLETQTLSDKVNPDTFNYVYRSAEDITNGYYCNDYVYNACLNEPGKYDEDCWPAWQTLNTKTGRCEDFAILDYALFKTLGVPESHTLSDEEVTVSLEMGYCSMPCACVKLAEQCGFDYNETSCAAPQYITVTPFGTFNACPSEMNNYPEGLNGSTYSLGVNYELFTVNQDFTLGSDYYYPLYLHKNFDDETDYFTGSREVIGSDVCDGYFKTFDELVEACAVFVSEPGFETAVRGVCGG
ncbi:MAG: transglutaminase-like domain-containing protein, partial [Candidatus Nanoarchaeia archaeon]